MKQTSRQFEEIKSWLINDLKYPQYVKTFEENGFDRWDILSELQIVHFFQLTGIKQGHAIRIHSALRSMQVKKEEEKNKFQYQKDAKLTQKTIDISLNSMLNSLKNIIEKYEWKLQRNINSDDNVNIERIEEIIHEIDAASNEMIKEMMKIKDAMQSQLKQIAETLSKKYVLIDSGSDQSVMMEASANGSIEMVTDEYVDETATFEVNEHVDTERKYSDIHAEEANEHDENEKKSRSNETNENYVVVPEDIPFDNSAQMISPQMTQLMRANTLPAISKNQRASLTDGLNVARMPADEFQDKVLQRLSQKLQDMSDQYHQQNDVPFQSSTARVSGRPPKYYERSRSAQPYRKSQKKRSMIGKEMKKVTVFKGAGHQNSQKRRQSLHSTKKRRAKTSRKSR